ncbi:hypothetical protein PF002_g23738 [Phytophthora fragariae]|uniref:Uncharacterized protein n=2 Tax=Phytophthora fragariae TaxID=53985 RepID=A0A6A3DR17_9STRA|nr:hypothetical protein PF009_g26859 [Phytophthora fragariae]KAE8981889.1 hypothetical protein PF011_g21846 [Phytophthora fragariae]KAE9081342.1 hypothetical protein PF007_g22700 [Phytophthora fragariae]KAE9097397.1 hypothetical protein PF006_g23587 [Phytophthora fragariae]KAE9193995.1 hypothetical protein PF002_g23738 [Phytophthora fragariae]
MATDSAALRLFRQFDGDDDEDVLAVLAVFAAYTEYTLPPSRPSLTGRQPNIDRGATEAHARLVQDYFADCSVYSDRTFRRRFRMRRALFLRIVNAIEGHDSYFQQRADATGKLGLSALQKCTAAIRQLAYGMPADAVDEYVRIAESNAIKSLLRFCSAVIEVFGDEYLRAPNEEDVQRLLAMHGERGFVGMLGSSDCMHWAWQNCPTAWAEQYSGNEEMPTIMLEAVVLRDLWFWHAFFVQLLHQRERVHMGYYLADGINPTWATLVKSIAVPRDNKEKAYCKMQ